MHLKPCYTFSLYEYATGVLCNTEVEEHSQRSGQERNWFCASVRVFCLWMTSEDLTVPVVCILRWPASLVSLECWWMWCDCFLVPSSCSLQLDAVGGVSDAHNTAMLESCSFTQRAGNGTWDRGVPLVFVQLVLLVFHCCWFYGLTIPLCVIPVLLFFFFFNFHISVGVHPRGPQLLVWNILLRLVVQYLRFSLTE